MNNCSKLIEDIKAMVQEMEKGALENMQVYAADFDRTEYERGIANACESMLNEITNEPFDAYQGILRMYNSSKAWMLNAAQWAANVQDAQRIGTLFAVSNFHNLFVCAKANIRNEPSPLSPVKIEIDQSKYWITREGGHVIFMKQLPNGRYTGTLTMRNGDFGGVAFWNSDGTSLAETKFDVIAMWIPSATEPFEPIEKGFPIRKPGIYVTRDGQIALITVDIAVATSEGIVYGVVNPGMYGEVARGWKVEDGRSAFGSRNLDIVGEWVEPKTEQ